MKRKLVAAAMAVAALTVSVAAQRSTKVTLVEYPAEITFWDRPADASGFPGDAIRSDGAVYRHGVGGVKAVLQVMSGGSNNNFLLNLSRATRPRRSINYDYTSQASTACDSDPQSPTGSLNDGGGEFWILNIAQMPVGATIAKQGAFNTAIGTFRFHDETKINPQNPYHCGQLLVVTRVSVTHWRVTTDIDPSAAYFNTAGLLVAPGDIAQLDASDNTFRGNYHMRFGADIYCATCR